MTETQKQEVVLIATLGSEPQIVGLAAHLLLEQHEPLTRVVVLHTRPTQSPIDRALPILQESFRTNAALPLLELQEAPADDVLTPQQIELFSRHLYQVVRIWVLRRTRVHLLLAGGRKSTAIVGMTVAQMLLGPDDRVWYLYSDEALRISGRLTLQPGDYAQLIQIPLPQLSAAPPVWIRPITAETPDSALDAYVVERTRRLRHFVEAELTSEERDVAALFAQDVLTVEEAATALHNSRKR